MFKVDLLMDWEGARRGRSSWRRPPRCWPGRNAVRADVSGGGGGGWGIKSSDSSMRNPQIQESEGVNQLVQREC